METWWWNDVNNSVGKKPNIQKRQKQANISKEKYLEEQKKAKRHVYQTKCKTEWKRHGNTMQADDQKCDAFMFAKCMVKTGQGIIGEQSIGNYDGVLAVTYEDKKIAWKSYHEKLLNTDFAWDQNILFQVDTVSSVLHLIDKDMIRKSISQMKNRKVAGLSVVALEIRKTA